MLHVLIYYVRTPPTYFVMCTSYRFFYACSKSASRTFVVMRELPGRDTIQVPALPAPPAPPSFTTCTCVCLIPGSLAKLPLAMRTWSPTWIVRVIAVLLLLALTLALALTGTGVLMGETTLCCSWFALCLVSPSMKAAFRERDSCGIA